MTDDQTTETVAETTTTAVTTTETAVAETPKAGPGRKKGPQQNGITRPGADTMIGKLWAIAEQESEKIGAPAPRKEVVARYLAEVPGAVLPTANTQYQRWLQYHGLADKLRDARKAALEEKEAVKLKATADAIAERDRKRALILEERAAAKVAREAKKTEADEKAAAAKAAREAKKAEAEAAKAAAAAAAASAPADESAPVAA
jgi:hypothetical protein